MKENISAGSRVKINTNTFNLSDFVPFISFFMFLLLIIVVFKVGLSKVLEQKRTIDNLRKKESLLLEKKNKLEKLNSDAVPIYFSSTAIFLPTKSPILNTLMGIKSLLSEYVLPVESYQVSLSSSESAGGDQVLTDGVRLEVIGEMEQVLLFLKRVENIVPLMSVERFNFSSEGELLTADLEIRDFWSPYIASKTAVSLDTPLRDLTEDEKKTLEVLSKMERFQFSQQLSPTGPYTRTNPFIE